MQKGNVIMEDKTKQTIPASPPPGCRDCRNHATLRNVSGKEDYFCDEHYRQELAVYNDFWQS
jgi:hypothetical protein